MKVSKILALLTIPFLLAGCGSSQGGSGGGGDTPTPTPSPTPDPDPEVKGVDFSKLTEEETRKYFTIDFDSIASLKSETSAPLSQTSKSAISTQEIRNAVIKKGDNYSISGTSRDITKLNRSEAVAFVNEMMGAGTVTEETVEDYLQQMADYYEGEYTLTDGVITLKVPSMFGGKHQYFASGKLTDNVMTVYSEQDDGSFYKINKMNVQPYKDFDFETLIDYAKYYKYNSENGRYEADISKFPIIQGYPIKYTTNYFTLKNDKLSYMVIEGTLKVGEKEYNLSDSIAIASAVASFDLPTNIKSCTHKYYEYYQQTLSAVDGKYYHYYFCGTCFNQKDHEQCTFDADGKCTKCENTPYKQVALQLTSDKSDVLAYASVNAITNKLNSVTINYDLGEYTQIPYNKEISVSGISLGEGEFMLVSYAMKVGSTYCFVASVTKQQNQSKFYVIEGAKMTETEEAVSFTEGTATLYTQGQVIKE